MIDVHPQKLDRTVVSYNWETGRREPKVISEATGWYEATTDEGLTAIGQTPEGARP